MSVGFFSPGPSGLRLPLAIRQAQPEASPWCHTERLTVETKAGGDLVNDGFADVPRVGECQAGRVDLLPLGI